VTTTFQTTIKLWFPLMSNANVSHTYI